MKETRPMLGASDPITRFFDSLHHQQALLEHLARDPQAARKRKWKARMDAMEGKLRKAQ